MTAVSPSRLTPRRTAAIIGALLLASAAAWALLVRQASTVPGNVAMPGGMEAHADMGLTMGMTGALFVGVWALMMVAIMFPTAAPMIVMFARIQQSRSERARPYVPTWIFAASYIALWIATGVLAYLLAVGLDALAQQSMWLMENGARLGGALILLAGAYQLSPLKEICLAKCRSPLGFISSSWRDGYGGALRMGLVHGGYCIGCCWMLFLILFPLGMMNLLAMIAVTLLIFAEKVLPLGDRVRQLAAVALIAYGGLVMFVPSALWSAG
jgi:predicted metal-binding membrane protein